MSTRSRWGGLALLMVAAASVAIGAGTILVREAPPPRDLGETYDAGPVFAAYQPTIEHQFRVRNNGKRMVKVVEKKCSCNCTTTDLSTDRIAPGESAVLNMSIRLPFNYSRSAEIRCELVFDDATTRVYSIAYESFPRVMVEPETIDLGSFGPDRELPGNPSKDARVTIFAPKDRTLARLQSLDDVVKGIRVEQLGEPEDGNRLGVQFRRYDLRLTPTQEFFNSSERGKNTFARPITFPTDGGTNALATLTWRFIDRYQVVPSPVFFGVVDTGGGPTNRTLLLRAKSSQPAKIKSISSNSSLVKHRIKTPSGDEAGATTQIVLSLVAPRELSEKAISGVLSVSMEDDRASIVNIPWSAVIRQQTGLGDARPEVPKGTRKEE